MSTNAGKNFTQQAYALGVGTTSTGAPVINTRDPTSNDVTYPQGKFWINETDEKLWYLNSFNSPSGVLTANWNLISQDSADLNTLTGDSGGAISPDGSANINILGGDTVKVVGDPGTNTLTITATGGGYPVTPYVVGPAGQAGYQTIQSALDAAGAAGGGLVFVQGAGSPYTENLVFPDGILIRGDSELNTTIIGTHTPPSTGSLDVYRLTLQSATDIFNSVAAGSSTIIVEDVTLNVTNGYSFNLPNWTGQIQLFDIGNFGTNDGGINNTAGMEVFIFSAGLGNGTTNTMNISGTTIFSDDVSIGCPVNFQSSGTLTSVDCDYSGSLTFSDSFSATFIGDSIQTGSNTPITQSSSGTLGLYNVMINSSAGTAIAGSGAGNVTIAGVNFANSNSISNTLTYTNTALLRNNGMVIGPQGDLSHTINGATVNSDLEIHSQATQDLGGITLHRHTNTALFGGHLIALRSNGTHASPTIVTDGDTIARFIAAGYDGTDYALGAEIQAIVEGTPGANDMPMKWSFLTSPDGTQVPVEGMGIYPDQTVNIPTSLNVGTNSPTVSDIEVNVEFDKSGAGVEIEVRNQSDTPDSTAIVGLSVGGSSGGDPYVVWSVPSATTYSTGIRNTDSDAWYWTGGAGQSGGLAATLLQKCTSAGEFTQPLQPAVLATHGVDQNNVTGAGATVTVNFTTEVFDQNGDYDGTNTYTSPVTGRTRFGSSVFLTELGAANTTGDINIVTSNRTYTYRTNIGVIRDAANSASISLNTFADMDAADTCTVTIVVSGGGGNTVDIPGSATTTYFTAQLEV